MKKTLRLLAILPFIFFGCGDDDSGPVPTHEIGTWDLDGFIISNVPADYSNNDGVFLDVSSVSFGGVTFESYEITFNINATYTREIEVPGPSINDNGTWVIEGDEDDQTLTLSSEDFDGDEEFDIVRNEDDALLLGTPSTFLLFSDAVVDSLNSLTQEQLDAITNEELNALAQPVLIDLIYSFDRKD